MSRMLLASSFREGQDRHAENPCIPLGSVANFAPEVLKGQLSLSVRGLCGQGVELFGRGEALLDSVVQRPFSQHVQQCDADESGLSRVKRFEP